jgi:diguanylate cyclase (GGDEF)-like protein/PAS domain S-box-containing protein
MKQVLVVEDEKVTALDLKLTLQDLGYQVVDTVSSGERAIEVLEQHSADLVLMDIHLDGEMLGTEAARIIFQRWGLPVVFLTAYSDTNTIDDASESLPYGYLVKPYERHEVDAALRIAFVRADADNEIRTSEERLRLALEAANMGIWEWQPDVAIEPLSDAPRVDLLPHDLESLMSVIHPDDRDHIRSTVKQTGHIQAVARLQDEQGDWRYHELHAALYEFQGAHQRVVGVYRDIHDQYLTREKLKQADVVFNNANEAILILDNALNTVSVNPSFTTITRFQPEDVLGRKPDQFLHARRHSDQFYPRLSEEDSRSWSGEIACRRKNGEIFPAWEHVCAVVDEHNQTSHYVVTFSDISTLKRAEKQLAQMAYLDSLTGIGNRVYLESELNNMLAACQEGQLSIAVLYIDLDGFKEINDTLGHAEGDQLLRRIASRLSESVRNEDAIARIGGDEFIIALHGVENRESAEMICEKLIERIKEPVQLSRETVSLSASIGVAMFHDNLSDYDAIVKAADFALFEAKRRGKNRYCIYDFNLAMENIEKLRIEKGLKTAIQNGEIQVELQPLVKQRGTVLYGAEVLVRWHSPELGIVPPDRFIPIAEQSSVILDIGDYVLRRSSEILASWSNTALDKLVLSVNIAPRQLADTRFPDELKKIIEQYQVDVDCLELEITESAVLNDNSVRPLLNRLRDLGVKLAIDDFGTGYSSLSRLKTMPFSRLKIDRMFVRDLPDSLNDLEICRAIIALCNVMDLRVTAEGVENAEQAQLLSDLGCTCLQGFHFSRSMPLARFEQWATDFFAEHAGGS